MININATRAIINTIQSIKPSSPEMQAYINSLGKEDYAALATAFDLGRDGWERNYYESDEYLVYMENMAFDETEVTQEMLDRKFLPVEQKKKQAEELYKHMISNTVKHNEAYNHNWLAQKTNLISAIRNGMEMLIEIV